LRGVSFWTRHADSTQTCAQAQSPAAAGNGGLQKLPEPRAVHEARPLCEGDVMKGKKGKGKGKGGKKRY
jgi:hypothetical protein